METERPVPPLLPDKKPEPVNFAENKLALWRSREDRPAIGAALENLGNTCFLNAVLQCVGHTVPLLQSLRLPPHPYPCAGDGGYFSGEEAKFCSVCALRQHIDVCINEGAAIVKPCGFVDNLSNICSSFSRYQQEDAHEFLHCLLDHLHRSSGSGGAAASMGNTSLIYSTFGGSLRSQIQCCECKHRSNTYEPLLDLSLEIEDASSLEEALQSFTRVERIDDPEIKLTCEGCKARVSVEKQLTLERAPLVAALHLKRFKSNGYFADKIDKFVKYPTELNLRPFLCDQTAGGELKYDLYAAVMHQGSSSLYGHYYCFVRPSPDSWFIMDDDKVYRVEEEIALTQNAYILFYAKRGTPWFSSFVEGGSMVRRTSPISVLDHVAAEQGSTSSSDQEESEKTDERESTLSPENGEDEEKAPSTPKQSPKDEPWEEVKEGQKRSGGREIAAAGSCLRMMPKARRQRLEELMEWASGGEEKRKVKKPKAQPEMEGRPLPSSLLHRLINAQEDAPNIVVSVKPSSEKAI